MATIFASDFHGTGDAYINKIMFMFHKHPEARIVFGGDYIDGRKQSKQVLNFVRQMQLNQNAVVLKGNHEDLMEQFMLLGIDKYGWYPNGAKTTIKSFFGQGFSKKIANYQLNQYRLYDGIPLRQWLASLPTVFVNEDACFVHAYIDTRWKNIQQAIKNTDEMDRLWNRNLVDNYNYICNHTKKAVVFGHTPTCFFESNRFNNSSIEIHKYQSKTNLKQSDPCPIIETHRKGDASLIACDGGCHGGSNLNTGNVAVIQKGKVIDWLN